MDTQEILPESIEEQSNAGLTEIEAAMDKISELENTDAPEQNLEENSENKTHTVREIYYWPNFLRVRAIIRQNFSKKKRLRRAFSLMLLCVFIQYI